MDIALFYPLQAVSLHLMCSSTWNFSTAPERIKMQTVYTLMSSELQKLMPNLYSFAFIQWARNTCQTHIMPFQEKK